ARYAPDRHHPDTHPIYFFIMQPTPPSSTLFPYTTLFRSRPHSKPDGARSSSSRSAGSCPSTSRSRRARRPDRLRRSRARRDLLRSEEHTSGLPSLTHIACPLLPVKKKTKRHTPHRSYTTP